MYLECLASQVAFFLVRKKLTDMSDAIVVIFEVA